MGNKLLQAVGYRVLEYVNDNGRSPFRDWVNEFDATTKARILARVFRFESGILGVYKSIGGGVFETKLDFGPGYRIYFGIVGTKIIILLNGGSKRHQSKDIFQSKAFLTDWKEVNKDGKKKP